MKVKAFLERMQILFLKHKQNDKAKVNAGIAMCENLDAMVGKM